jgi:hypothetical protein
MRLDARKVASYAIREENKLQRGLGQQECSNRKCDKPKHIRNEGSLHCVYVHYKRSTYTYKSTLRREESTTRKPTSGGYTTMV